MLIVYVGPFALCQEEARRLSSDKEVYTLKCDPSADILSADAVYVLRAADTRDVVMVSREACHSTAHLVLCYEPSSEPPESVRAQAETVIRHTDLAISPQSILGQARIEQVYYALEAYKSQDTARVKQLLPLLPVEYLYQWVKEAATGSWQWFSADKSFGVHRDIDFLRRALTAAGTEDMRKTHTFKI